MLDSNFFNTFFVFPILNILVFLYKIFLFLKTPGAFGFAVISLTILVRLAFHPFFKHQLSTAKKLQELKPHLDKLAKKHKNDKKKLQEEQLKLYQKAGINPTVGCLFMIVQIPIFIALYQTFSLFLLNGNSVKIINQINQVLYSPFLKIESINPWFLGFNLALSPAKASVWYYYLIPLITFILQYLQGQGIKPQSNQSNQQPVAKEKKEENSHNDFQKAIEIQMRLIFPFMIAWFSYNLPVGLSLYWNIFSIFSLIQYKKLKV